MLRHLELQGANPIDLPIYSLGNPDAREAITAFVGFRILDPLEASIQGADKRRRAEQTLVFLNGARMMRRYMVLNSFLGNGVHAWKERLTRQPNASAQTDTSIAICFGSFSRCWPQIARSMDLIKSVCGWCFVSTDGEFCDSCFEFLRMVATVNRKKMFSHAFLSAWVIVLPACVTETRLAAPPLMRGEFVPTGGTASVRIGSSGLTLQEDQISALQTRIVEVADDGSIDILALSGGGSGGAFGAGVLIGLTQAQSRPRYEVVTGVSTGALIAPFAFLGSEWDAKLAEAFDGRSTDNLLRPLRARAVFSTSFYEGYPLQDLVAHYVTDEMLEAIAGQSADGRLLLVATTNLDSEETVIWNMSEIAALSGPAAKQLFIDVLVASASVPGIFPPVLLSVNNGADTFNEMHVDGSTSAPFFVAPQSVTAVAQDADALRGANVYVIANTQLAGKQRATPVNTLAILNRSFVTTINHMARDEIGQTLGFAMRNDINLQVTAIPSSFPFAGSLAFDADSMHTLFSYGERCASQGLIWVDIPQAIDHVAHDLTSAANEEDACPVR